MLPRRQVRPTRILTPRRSGKNGVASLLQKKRKVLAEIFWSTGRLTPMSKKQPVVMSRRTRMIS